MVKLETDIVEERGREDENHTNRKDIGRNSSEMGGYEEKGRNKLLQRQPAGIVKPWT